MTSDTETVQAKKVTATMNDLRTAGALDGMLFSPEQSSVCDSLRGDWHARQPAHLFRFRRTRAARHWTAPAKPPSAPAPRWLPTPGTASRWPPCLRARAPATPRDPAAPFLPLQLVRQGLESETLLRWHNDQRALDASDRWSSGPKWPCSNSSSQPTPPRSPRKGGGPSSTVYWKSSSSPSAGITWSVMQSAIKNGPR